MSEESKLLKNLYEARFDKDAQIKKNEIWKVLCSDFFQKFVKRTDTVVDIGAGYCEFINHIQCSHKIAVDLNPDVAERANADIKVINESCTQISSLASNSVDCVFMSNFLEHLPSKELVLSTLRESQRILKPGGRVMILQPNIRFLPGEYWDYFDHHTALTDRSLAEALVLAGFEVSVCIPRFLPYTTKSRLPQSPWLVALYLRLPFFWRFLGKQAFLVGTVPA
ncbi:MULTISPECIES: class I SAM-dependent methyltransferase [unclassified Rhodanobacter]|uniref:Class I SAM-dependent methyltransferase n=1 Tax=Rhodanobacter humi TaxID=1888173 RepID=A0ABV4ASH4_9GAMM